MLAWFDRHFAIGVGAGRFWPNVVLLSLAGLLPALWVFVARTPGFAGHLAQADGALAPFLRQVLTTGLPVVVLVNAVAMASFARLRAGVISPVAALARDVTGRVGLFAALQGALFAGSAQVFGAFGGDPVQGLRVLGPTLEQAAVFGNLAGAYFYAAAVSALPLYLAVAQRSLRGPQGAGPAAVATAVALFAVHALALAVFGRVLTFLL